MPGGRVVGLDADPAHTALARQYADELELANVEVVTADARHTGLPGQEPDLEHALCYPPLPPWDRLVQVFTASDQRLGADRLIGRRLTELFRQLADPRTVAMPHLLFVARGRKPAA